MTQAQRLHPASAAIIFEMAKEEAARQCVREGCVHEFEALVIAREWMADPDAARAAGIVSEPGR